MLSVNVFVVLLPLPLAFANSLYLAPYMTLVVTRQESDLITPPHGYRFTQISHIFTIK